MQGHTNNILVCFPS